MDTMEVSSKKRIKDAKGLKAWRITLLKSPDTYLVMLQLLYSFLGGRSVRLIHRAFNYRSLLSAHGFRFFRLSQGGVIIKVV